MTTSTMPGSTTLSRWAGSRWADVGDSRLKPSAVTALIFSIPQRNLVITGKPVR